MAIRKIRFTIISFLTLALLLLGFSAGFSMAQELTESEEELIEHIINVFDSEPELGMKLLEDLAEENPELAVLVIVELAKEAPDKAVIAIVNLVEINPSVAARGLVAIGELFTELAETQPELAATLKAVLSQSITGMVESGSGRGAGVAAVVVNSCKQSNPELGKFLEEEAVAAGLERFYLLAASPIIP